MNNNVFFSGEGFMRKALAMAAVLFSLVGCSNDNQIEIDNISQGAIYFNFRANQTYVPKDSSRIIKDIPNGSYTYNTTFELPDGAVTWTVAGNAGSGSLRFSKELSRHLLIYSATLDKTGLYTLYVNETSSDSTGGATSILLGP
jgi:hypothetical protein